MYPLGHMVSDMSSTVILGRGACWAVQNRRGRTDAHVRREEALGSMLRDTREATRRLRGAAEARRRRGELADYSDYRYVSNVSK